MSTGGAKREEDGAIVIPSPSQRWSALRPILLAVFLILFTGTYFYLARHLINQTNSNRNRSDQQNNINLALKAKEDIHLNFKAHGSNAVWRWFPRHTDGVVNPLWPWLAARVHSEGMSDQEFFKRGKWLNVGLTIGLLLVGGVFAASKLSLLATINLMLLVGLGAFLPRAVWFQPEPTYFMAFLLAWLAAVFALMKNALWRYALFGVLCGLAYLAKASALPLLLAFIGITTARWLWEGGRTLVQKRHGKTDAHWCPQAHIIGSVLCILAFLTTSGPRLNYAKEQYSSAFHSYPSYWMWLDQFEPDCIDFMLAYNTAEKLSDIPAETKPSFGNYLEQKGSAAFFERLKTGSAETARDFLQPKRAKIRKTGPDPWRVLLDDRGKYLFALALLLLALWLWSTVAKPKAEVAALRLHPEALTIVAFVAGTFLLYLLLYGWYRPVGKGDRFMLSLYAPLAVSLIWGAESIRARIERRGGSRPLAIAYFATHAILACAIVVRLVQISSSPSFFTK